MSHDHLHMSVYSIKCFTDDGKLDAEELQKILDIAERDGHVGDDEIRVLGNIIARVQPHELDQALSEKIAAINAKLGTDFKPAATV